MNTLYLHIFIYYISYIHFYVNRHYNNVQINYAWMSNKEANETLKKIQYKQERWEQ